MAWRTLNDILKVRDELLDDILGLVRGQSVDNQTAHQLADLCATRLEVDRNRVYETLQLWPHKLMDYANARELATLLCGGRSQLDAGLVLNPSIDPTDPVYGACEISDGADDSRTHIVLTLKVLSGPLTTRVVQRRFTRKFCWLLALDLGYTRRALRWSGRPEGLVRMHLEAMIYHRFQLTFDEYRVAPYMRRRNMALIRMRRLPCDKPQAYTWSCEECPIGWDRCSRGCHPTTWPRNSCPGLDQGVAGLTYSSSSHAGFFKPGSGHTLCYECRKAVSNAVTDRPS